MGGAHSHLHIILLIVGSTLLYIIHGCRLLPWLPAPDHGSSLLLFLHSLCIGVFRTV